MPSAIADDVAPQHYAVSHVPRPVVDGGPERGGGVAVVFRQSVIVRRHPLTNKMPTKDLRVAACPCRHVAADAHGVQHLPAAVDVVRRRVRR